MLCKIIHIKTKKNSKSEAKTNAIENFLKIEKKKTVHEIKKTIKETIKEITDPKKSLIKRILKTIGIATGAVGLLITIGAIDKKNIYKDVVGLIFPGNEAVEIFDKKPFTEKDINGLVEKFKHEDISMRTIKKHDKVFNAFTIKNILDMNLSKEEFLKTFHNPILQKELLFIWDSSKNGLNMAINENNYKEYIIMQRIVFDKYLLPSDWIFIENHPETLDFYKKLDDIKFEKDYSKKLLLINQYFPNLDKNLKKLLIPTIENLNN